MADDDGQAKGDEQGQEGSEGSVSPVAGGSDGEVAGWYYEGDDAE